MILYSRLSSTKGTHAHQNTSKRRDSVFCRRSEMSQTDYENICSRVRLDARLWITGRLALVESLNHEVRGMGEVKGMLGHVLKSKPFSRLAYFDHFHIGLLTFLIA